MCMVFKTEFCCTLYASYIDWGGTLYVAEKQSIPSELALHESQERNISTLIHNYLKNPVPALINHRFIHNFWQKKNSYDTKVCRSVPNL